MAGKRICLSGYEDVQDFVDRQVGSDAVIVVEEPFGLSVVTLHVTQRSIISFKMN